MDDILKAANNFVHLLDKKYRLVLAKSGKVVEVEITFQKSDFHHLCGLQYIKDNRNIRRDPRANIFNDIINGKITDETLKKSAYFNDDIENRVKNAQTLESFLDNTMSVFKFLHNGVSRIDFDFMFKSTNANNVYLYITKKDGIQDGKQYTCNSFYARDASLIDTSVFHTRYTLLLKEKIHIPTGHVEELFRARSYTSSGETALKAEKISISDSFGTPALALAGVGGAAAVDYALPPGKSPFEPIKKFFSGIAKPFKDYIEYRREVRALKKELKSAKNEIVYWQVENDKIAEVLEKERSKNSELSEEIKAMRNEIDKTAVKLGETEQKLKNTTELSNRRGKLLREENEILNEYPELKADYIRARDEHRGQLQKPPKSIDERPKPKHRR